MNANAISLLTAASTTLTQPTTMLVGSAT